MTYHPLSPVWEAQMASPVASSGGPGGGHPSPSAVESFAFVFCFIFVTLRCPRFMNHSASTRLQRRGFFLLSGYRKLHIHAHICTHITHICIQLHYLRNLIRFHLSYFPSFCVSIVVSALNMMSTLLILKMHNTLLLILGTVFVQ